MRKIKYLKNKLSITAIYFCCLAVFWLLKLPSVFDYIFGIPCLGCGMSHAVLSALQFDFAKAFSYHSMFWSMPILYLYFLFDGKLFKRWAIDVTILILIALGFLINWLANCANCGNAVAPEAEVCLNCGVAIKKAGGDLAGKDKVTIALVCFFLGGLGIHNFMMGETKKGIVKIVLSFCFYIGSILALIDFIKILMDKYEVNPDKVF